MKTIKEHFDFLPEPFRSQALNNLPKSKEDKRIINYVQAIGTAFSWEDSPEGHEYWREFINRPRLKTVKEYFEGFQEPHKSLALANMGSQQKDALVNNPREALLGGFKWSESREGVKFWITFNSTLPSH